MTHLVERRQLSTSVAETFSARRTGRSASILRGPSRRVSNFRGRRTHGSIPKPSLPGLRQPARKTAPDQRYDAALCSLQHRQMLGHDHVGPVGLEPTTPWLSLGSRSLGTGVSGVRPENPYHPTYHLAASLCGHTWPTLAQPNTNGARVKLARRALNGGEAGIRTLGHLAATPVFETGPFDHSGTSPSCFLVVFCCLFAVCNAGDFSPEWPRSLTLGGKLAPPRASLARSVFIRRLRRAA